jgi:hypothetical protein
MATTVVTQSPSQEEKPVVVEVTLSSAIDFGKKEVKQAQVHSVELTNAIVKDNPNYWSASQIQLYGIMFFATLSMPLACSSVIAS